MGLLTLFTWIFGIVRVSSGSLGDRIQPETMKEVHPGAVNRKFMLDYLIKYGFIDGKDNQTDMTTGVSAFQRSVGLPATGVLDARTLTLMSAPRCGVTDRREHPKGHGNVRRKRYLILHRKWHEQDNVLTWKINTYTNKLDHGQTRRVMMTAFQLWSDVTNLQFRETSGAALLNLGFHRGKHTNCAYKFDGPGGTLAHAFYPPSGKVHFDDEEAWVIRKEKGRDGTPLLPVAMHEIGHALGLSHTDVPQAIMYAISNPTTYPHPDDIAAIQYFYGRKTPRPTEPLWKRNVASLAPEGEWLTLRKTTVQTTLTPTPADLPPRLCDSTLRVNALERIGGETFIFSGKWYWRVPAGGRRRRLRYDWRTAHPIKGLWPRLPLPESGLDAVYMRTSEGKNELIVFVGKRYWKASSRQLSDLDERSGPITDFDLPSTLQRVDAVFSPKDDVTYFISGSNYWRYDEKSRRTSGRKNLDSWRGLRSPVDAAFKHNDGEVYFLQGSRILKFDFENMKMSNDGSFPKPWMSHFFNCPAVALSSRHDKLHSRDSSQVLLEQSSARGSATPVQICITNIGLFALLALFII